MTVNRQKQQKKAAVVNTSTEATPQAPAKKLFLVEGFVRAQSQSGAATQSEQRRLVWAKNENDAGTKYTDYFTAMNTPEMGYVVLGAAISKAID